MSWITQEMREEFHSIGDVNWDGVIDMWDVNAIATAMGSMPGMPKWNPDADINGDGIVDVRDAAVCAIHYGLTLRDYFKQWTKEGWLEIHYAATIGTSAERIDEVMANFHAILEQEGLSGRFEGRNPKEEYLGYPNLYKCTVEIWEQGSEGSLTASIILLIIGALVGAAVVYYFLIPYYYKVQNIKKEIEEMEKDLAAFEDELDKAYSEGKIDEETYQALKEKLSSVWEHVDKIKDETGWPGWMEGFQQIIELLPLILVFILIMVLIGAFRR